MDTPPALDGAARDFLKALASETRQQMMTVFAGGRELTVGEIAECCGLGQSTASEQLAILRRGGLVQSTSTAAVDSTGGDCCGAPAIETAAEAVAVPAGRGLATGISGGLLSAPLTLLPVASSAERSAERSAEKPAEKSAGQGGGCCG